jgi:glycerol-3-phosphate acyltransferase PlsY
MLNLAIILILSYLVGSIPTSIIVSKLAKGIDIREYGSGNAGGTNTIRVLGWKYGIFVILFDAFKGAFAVIVIARLFAGNLPFSNQTPFDNFTLVQILAGIAAVLGHVWTIFAGFKGGKGLATALGFLVSIVPIDMAIAVSIFFILAFATKYVSLGSISAAIALPLVMIIRENVFGVDIPGYHTILPFVILTSALVIYTHRSNIARLLKGQENKLNVKKHSKEK